MTEGFLMVVVFLVATALAMAALYWLGEMFRARKQPLIPEDDDSPRQPLMGPYTATLGSQVPMTAEGRSALVQDLRAAGYYHPLALAEFNAIRWYLLIVPFVATALVCLYVDKTQIPVVVIVGGVVLLLGYSLPRIWVNGVAKKRTRRIEKAIPFAVDLLIMCLSAGQNVFAAFRQVARELRRTQPDLAYEMEITHRQAEIGSLEHSLVQMADRVQVPEVRNLALILAQSERLGADAAVTLQEFATSFRTTLKQRAEEQANRTSFWMLIPSVYCLLTAAAIILIAPAYLEFAQERKAIEKEIKEARPTVEKVGASPSLTPAEKTKTGTEATE